jgi:hypothetical protein
MVLFGCLGEKDMETLLILVSTFKCNNFLNLLEVILMTFGNTLLQPINGHGLVGITPFMYKVFTELKEYHLL